MYYSHVAKLLWSIFAWPFHSGQSAPFTDWPPDCGLRAGGGFCKIEALLCLRILSRLALAEKRPLPPLALAGVPKSPLERGVFISLPLERSETMRINGGVITLMGTIPDGVVGAHLLISSLQCMRNKCMRMNEMEN